VHVGLFPGANWLKTRRTKVQSFADSPDHDAGALLRHLAAMLDSIEDKPRKGSNVVMTVSDSVAVIATMPWQPSLSRTEEINSYARICLEKLGMAIDDDWSMHAEFRHYGAMGLVYALPNAWLAELLDLLKTRELKLRTVLPASAKAYAYRASRQQTGKSLILMQEALRSTAVLLGDAGLCGYDVEPVIESSWETSVRLLKRMGARHNDVLRVIHWGLDSLEEKPLPGFVTACLPSATCQPMAHDAWDR
jgi:hypothetical protein